MHEISVLIPYAQTPLINVHAGISNKVRGRSFGLSPILQPYFLYASSEVSDESVQVSLLLIDVVSTKSQYLYPRYEVYRGYIVFAFSVIMIVCLFVCLFVNFFSVKDFSATTWVRILKFGTKLDSGELYCVTEKQPHIAYQSLYLFIFLSLQ